MTAPLVRTLIIEKRSTSAAAVCCLCAKMSPRRSENKQYGRLLISYKSASYIGSSPRQPLYEDHPLSDEGCYDLVLVMHLGNLCDPKPGTKPAITTVESVLGNCV